MTELAGQDRHIFSRGRHAVFLDESSASAGPRQRAAGLAVAKVAAHFTHFSIPTLAPC